MDIAESLRKMAERISEQSEHIQTEEGTKLALINPFIRDVLGYDTSDVREVRPEYTADVGTKKGEKVDYAILVDGNPVILIEAKKVGTPLEQDDPTQLYRYFNAVPSARFGIYTDGVKYLFFSDLDKDNLMDTRPFLTLDLTDQDPSAIAEIGKFVKAEFDPDGIRSRANQLKYTMAIKRELQTELDDPSEELVRLLMGRVFDGRKTQERLEQFAVFTKSAAAQVFRDSLRGRLNAALEREAGPAEEPELEVIDESSDGIITTEDELNAYFAVKAIVHGIVDPARVTMRDQKTMCLILLDDNRRQWLCRLYFNTSQYRLGLPDDDGNEYRVSIDSVNQLFDYTDALRKSAQRLM